MRSNPRYTVGQAAHAVTVVSVGVQFIALSPQRRCALAAVVCTGRDTQRQSCTKHTCIAASANSTYRSPEGRSPGSLPCTACCRAANACCSVEASFATAQCCRHCLIVSFSTIVLKLRCQRGGSGGCIAKSEAVGARKLHRDRWHVACWRCCFSYSHNDSWKLICQRANTRCWPRHHLRRPQLATQDQEVQLQHRQDTTHSSYRESVIVV